MITNINVNIKKIIFPAVLVICFIAVFGLGAWFGATKLSYKVEQPGTLDFSLFWDAYNKLQQYFVDPSKIDNQKITYGAISGMTSSLGDPYTSFFDPEQAKRFEQDLSGSFSGIGAEIGVRKGAITIVAPLKSTPAEKAGLKSGDIITKINNEDTTNMTSDEAVNLIRGERGTTVTLTIYREDWGETKDIIITRDTIVVPSMALSILASTGEAGGKDDNVAYIQIFQFDENLGSDFKKAATQILQSNAKKIVLDLRDNPGGYLEMAQNVAGWFLKTGEVVTTEDYGDNRESDIYYAQGNGSLSDYPTVVLINEGSASASEILAGALRDNRSVKLVGQKSFGKGSVQEVINLSDGSFLKITIAKWLTPKGASISEVGLTPDVKVEITEKDIEAQKDPQLNKALEIVKNLK